MTTPHLDKTQPLDANLQSLRDQPSASLKAFGKEWAAMCAGSAIAEIARLQAMSVTHILLTVVPGEDGMGHEVYARSVADVEDKLSELAERADDADALRTLIKEAPRYFSPHDFDGDKLKWLQAAGLA